ncbi:hypothetical protein GDO86_012193 [Hymenochirus boettgeri]|uniref:G-protein coupled receptors family 1 profile domain-containing protein n=1 Tax=Hymenochirus boettgeri TaxID=247094 RepID=A0A8T2IRR4_9PIPI|nr:hypothetical protein GDO86_012193 [Hymenochirus boettgeri]
MHQGAPSQLILSVYVLTFLTGLPCNLLAFYAFLVKVRQRPTPVDIILLNLTISDLILLMFLPFKMDEAASNMQWRLPQFLCPLTGFCYYSSIYLSTMFLTAVSVERYLGVAYPIKYKLNRKPGYAIIASVVIWILACANCSIVYIVQNGLPPNETLSKNATFSCYENFTAEQLKILLPVRLELGLLLFFVPFIITTYCYVNFIRILTSLPNIQAKRKKRAIGLAAATLTNFIMCFFPYNISHIVGFVQNKSPEWRVYALLLTTFNASLDPIVFYFSSSAVQRMVCECFKGVTQKLKALCPCNMSSPSPCEVSGKDYSMDLSLT